MPEEFTSPFATANTTAEEVSALIEAGLAHMKPDGTIAWDQVAPTTSIGYSRGWLIVRRAYLEQNEPSSLVTLPERSKFGADAEGQALYERACSKVIQGLRDSGISWGEIAVRVGMPESRVRKLFRTVDNRKDLGLRIGKGGRFAYGDPTLYLDNRKAEGAHIPVDLKVRPTPEMLLNFEQREQRATGGNTTSKRSQAWAKGTITKLLRLRNDPATPVEQHEAIDAKIADLRSKYNIAA